MPKYLLSFVLVFGMFHKALSQKMLLIERANRAKTTRLYIGMTLQYAMASDPKYWYERTITDIQAEQGTLLLDNFPTRISEIGAIKVHKKGFFRFVGAALAGFGVSLAVANTVAVIRGDGGPNVGLLYGVAAASGGTGWFLNQKRTLRLGEQWRLRPIEIRFD